MKISLWVLFLASNTATAVFAGSSTLLSPTSSSHTAWRTAPTSSIIPSSLKPSPNLKVRPGDHQGRYGVRSVATTLRGGSTSLSVDELANLACEWCFHLGAPAALVAGATVATLYENIRGGALDVSHDDTPYIRYAKKVAHVLLLSAFGLQITSIFVTTVTGTMLIERDWDTVTTTATTGLGFMREHLEFEYLTARISFLQGLLNWLAGVAVEHTIPRPGQGTAARQMDQFVASSLGTLLIMLLAFYNSHCHFYHNYLHMLVRWKITFFQRFVRSLRSTTYLLVPMLCLSIVTGIRVIRAKEDGPTIQEVVEEETTTIRDKKIHHLEG